MIFAPFGFRQGQVVSVGPTPTPTPTSTPTPTPSPTPSIPTSGLTLYLDAGNTSSYSGSGTDWFDLSGNDNHGTLTNGPTYSSDNGGSIVFDGVNDYVTFSSVSGMPTGNTEYTIVSFVKKDNETRRDGIIGYGTSSTNRYLGFRTMGPPFETNGLVNYWWASDFEVNTTISANTWYNFTSKFDKVTNQRQMYINDSSIGTNTPSGTYNLGPQTNLSVGLSYGTDYIDGNISVILVYNRSLTNTELTQVWDYFKGRYGY